MNTNIKKNILGSAVIVFVQAIVFVITYYVTDDFGKAVVFAAAAAFAAAAVSSAATVSCAAAPFAAAAAATFVATFAVRFVATFVATFSSVTIGGFLVCAVVCATIGIREIAVKQKRNFFLVFVEVISPIIIVWVGIDYLFFNFSF